MPSATTSREDPKINSVDLINADCLHFIQSLPDDSIDLIVTDPPYFKVKPNG
ncbi:TPA: site-specific DNA-methyltransferase, partial [Escherichia coli]|nr:site-specific DNA-methyltransferase [Escherichia coli]